VQIEAAVERKRKKGARKKRWSGGLGMAGNILGTFVPGASE